MSGTLSGVVRFSPVRNCQRLITACVTKSKKLCCQGKTAFQGSSYLFCWYGKNRLDKTEGKALMNQAGLVLREVKFGVLVPSAAALVCEFFLRWLNRTRIAPHTAAWKFVPCNFCFLAKAELQRNEGEEQGVWVVLRAQEVAEALLGRTSNTVQSYSNTFFLSFLRAAQLLTRICLRCLDQISPFHLISVWKGIGPKSTFPFLLIPN